VTRRRDGPRAFAFRSPGVRDNSIIFVENWLTDYEPSSFFFEFRSLSTLSRKRVASRTWHEPVEG
jgi:hypothetical protein